MRDPGDQVTRLIEEAERYTDPGLDGAIIRRSWEITKKIDKLATGEVGHKLHSRTRADILQSTT